MRVLTLDLSRAPDAQGASRDAAAAVIRHHRPDVIALQGCAPRDLADVDDALWPYRRVRLDGDGPPPRNPLYHDAARLRVEDAGTEILPGHPAPDPDAGGDDEDAPRTVAWATLRDNHDRAHAVASVHLDATSRVAREHAARVILRALPGFVLAGDFGEDAGGPVHAALMAVHWRDAAARPGGSAWVLVPVGVELRGHARTHAPPGAVVADVLPRAQALPAVGEVAAFLRLKAWRMERARADGVRAFAIAHDETLRELARVLPASIHDLPAVRGVGPLTVERYGQEILRVIHGPRAPAAPAERRG